MKKFLNKKFLIFVGAVFIALWLIYPVFPPPSAKIEPSTIKESGGGCPFITLTHLISAIDPQISYNKVFIANEGAASFYLRTYGSEDRIFVSGDWAPHLIFKSAKNLGYEISTVFPLYRSRWQKINFLTTWISRSKHRGVFLTDSQGIKIIKQKVAKGIPIGTGLGGDYIAVKGYDKEYLYFGKTELNEVARTLFPSLPPAQAKISDFEVPIIFWVEKGKFAPKSEKEIEIALVKNGETAPENIRKFADLLEKGLKFKDIARIESFTSFATARYELATFLKGIGNFKTAELYHQSFLKWLELVKNIGDPVEIFKDQNKRAITVKLLREIADIEEKAIRDWKTSLNTL